MKTTKIISASLMMTSIALATGVQAHDRNDGHFSRGDCSIDLNNGVTVTPEYIKVFNDQKTLYRIHKDGSMTVDGQAVNLSAAQQQISASYGQGIRDSVPEAIEIAYSAMEMASKGATTALGTLFGENSDIEQQVTVIIDKAKAEIEANFERSESEFTIGPNGFDDIDSAFDEEFEKEIEKIAMNSMGSIFTLLGQVMSEGNGDFEQRMEAFGEKMEKMGEELEVALEAETEQIEEQADQLCQQLKMVDDLETQLQQQIPAFAKHELLDMQMHSE